MELGRKPEQLVGQSTLAARPLKGEPRQALVVQRNPLVDRCALVGHWRPRAHFQAEVARARRYLRTTSAVMSPPRSLPAEDNHGPSSGEALGGLLAGPGPWPGLPPRNPPALRPTSRFRRAPKVAPSVWRIVSRSSTSVASPYASRRRRGHPLEKLIPQVLHFRPPRAGGFLGVDLAVEQDCGGSVSGSQRRLALRLAEERVTLDARGGSLA